MSLKIVRNDIVKMNTEAIVNTANDQPTVGTGCDHAVYTAAGYDKLLKYRKEEIGFVQEGDVFITPGFRLSAKYIIHAVSPRYQDGNNNEEEKLRSCYRQSLTLAKERGVKSIAFPLIATGGFGYPKEEGMRIALDEINYFLMDNDMDIRLVVFDTKSVKLGEKVYPELTAYIDHNYVLEKREEEYGDRYVGSCRRTDSEYNQYSEERMELEERFEKKSKSVSRSSVIKPNVDAKFGDISDWGGAAECVSDSSEADYEEQLRNLKSKLDERKKHLSDTFSEYLLYLITEREMTNAEVYKRAIVDKKLFAKIKNDKNYHPQKLTCLCLCIGAKLNLDESRDLLARAGYALSPCDMRDVIFTYFIENQIFDIIELDITLEEYGLPCIIV